VPSRDLLRSLPLLIGLLATAAGCGSRESPSTAQAPAAGAPAPAAAPAEAPSAAPGPALPPPGKVLVQATPAGVTLLANQAPRMRILDGLAGALHFSLIVRDPVPPGDPLTVEARELPLEEVLGRALEGLPFQIAYDVEPESGRHLVRAVVIGSFRNAVARDAGPEGRPGARLGPRGERREREAPSAEELARRQEAEKQTEAEIARDLESSDAATRAEAVSSMRSESDNLPKLSDLMLHDPSPEVRAAAAERLGGVGSNEAVNALLRGLGDPDPHVVLSAIDALNFAGDQTVVPDLKNLLQHPDPKVREAAKQAIESLE